MLVISITRKVSLADGQPYIPPFFKINRCLLFHFCLTLFNDILQFICMHKTEGNPYRGVARIKAIQVKTQNDRGKKSGGPGPR